jgi:putative glycosyltransferase (TIGR04372 family)
MSLIKYIKKLLLPVYKAGIFLLKRIKTTFDPLGLLIFRANKTTLASIYLRQGFRQFGYLKKLIVQRDVRKSDIIDTAKKGVKLFDLVLKNDPLNVDALRLKMKIYYIMGDAINFLNQLKEIHRAKLSISLERKTDKLGLRFIPPYPVMKTIGNSCVYEGYFKAQILSGNKANHVMVFDHKDWSSFVNPHLMTYWSQYVKIIDDPVTAKILQPIAEYQSDEDGGPIVVDEQVLPTHSALALIQKHWDQENRPPLFKLKRRDRERGRKELKNIGVNDNDWFVCLHIRESGAKGDEPFRQAPIEDYFLAVKSITDRGGWVIRMGDPSMTPWPKMGHVFDYACSSIRKDWLDVFLCGACRFFIGTSSGLYTVAHNFGRPIVQTNYLPTSSIYLSRQDLFIPKLLFNKTSKIPLTFEEMMQPPVSMAASDGVFASVLGLSPLNNTSKEIMEVVIEMLDKLDGKFQESEEDIYLQKQFNSLTADVGTLIGLKGIPLNCRIGKDFLHRHKDLLEVIMRENTDSPD